jgi:hypothetical protein
MISGKTPGTEDQIIILLNIHGVSEAVLRGFTRETRNWSVYSEENRGKTCGWYY